MKKIILFICLTVFVMNGSPVSAADDTLSGMEVSPSRQTITADAGQTRKAQINVSNDSAALMNVPLVVEEMTADDKRNALAFKTTEHDWVKPDETSISLTPGERSQANFTVSIPQNAASGEYYFALIASNQTDQKTVRVASVVYLFVNGGDIERTSTLENSNVPTLSFGGPVRYGFDMNNTGNIHIDTRSNAYLKGLSWYSSNQDTYQSTLPRKSNHISDTVPQPFFPGVYTLTYGYTEEQTQKTTALTARIIYIPPWSIASIILLLLIAAWIWQKRKR